MLEFLTVGIVVAIDTMFGDTTIIMAVKACVINVPRLSCSLFTKLETNLEDQYSIQA